MANAVAVVEDRPEAARSLTDFQWRFVQNFFLDFNAAEAARRAGYEGKRAKQTGYELINTPKVAEAIAELAPAYMGLNRGQILQGMGKLAFRLGGQDRSVQLQALDRLAKIAGLYKEGPQGSTQVHIHIWPEESNL